ncbi:UBX domain-containing protein 5 [Komagataella phaffii CBS 7435]|uniref:UBX (Ubiquitin regulatory X) domain-containing protein n=2 Tax=Komagataella phaffii TaxID=460519 RepID=C4R464_KOMPG|nr:UBX (ubiquitin regulatory X) domain-containing protein [Komagataella phaffii GS115]AOA63208.1 GQ67_03370T0 [Komagataella phaffii]CAH2449903.1 UBX domain-containing protein 5 [Komagataella phaffii CBS 7435]AOA69391.1 GQ68_03339T0 [Komagataella phaffii GS115]CAY70350.1 UBX (ubiquitin regulatory X) domain-containing protein [Komagataella phaffii GS115]CCA39857.1 UBX domain-containing protein 5 [Komagataella phaffii CBS 7435]
MSSVDTFLAITNTEDAAVAQQFIEMAGGDIDTAVSLFFEHGTDATATDNNPVRSDEQLAQDLQNDAYNDEVRAPIQPVTEQLVDTLYPVSGNGIPIDPSTAIFGSRPTGIFNQTFGGDQEEIDDDVDNQFETIMDEEGNIVQRHRSNYSRGIDVDNMTATQRRLANLFRPPFDIMEKYNLATAKTEARSKQKWILINIQDPTEFQCQMLNRDFWSNTDIKDIVHENFVFLQYQKDSVNGDDYTNFYHFESFPHIAILDPMTGERLKVWSTVPNISDWIEQVVDFLSSHSLTGATGSVTPLPQQRSNQAELISLDSAWEDAEEDGDEEESAPGSSESEGSSIQIINNNTTLAIKPIENEEPPQGPDSTRIQIRTSDGKRVVRRFLSSDTVRSLFEFVKFYFKDIIENHEFQLTSQRVNLFESLGNTIEEANLKNASVLLEVIKD